MVMPVMSEAAVAAREEGVVARDGPARLLRRIERRPIVLILLLIGLCLGMVRLACGKIPAVSNMDEFSVLLQADTFRHLRLSNPTHPLWPSFETLHVIQVPSYASKFPPAPAALMALGETIFGNPIWGTWLSIVAATLAVFWMFSAWLPRRWAFIGALFALMNPVVLFWGRTYLACGLGLAGAALAIGAARRILRRGRWLDGGLLALGLGVLANTRPFEGLLLALLIAAWFAPRIPPRRLLLAARGAVPVGLAILGFMAYYNWRVTGNPLELPHVTHHKQYDMAPSFIFQDALPAPEYRDPHIWQFHRWELRCWEGQHGSVPWIVIYRKLLRLGTFFKSPAGLLILLLPLAWRNSPVRGATIGAIIMAAAMVTSIWLNLNYTSPISALFLIMQVGCLRWLIRYRPMQTAGNSPSHLWRAIAVVLTAASVVVAVPLARSNKLNDSKYGEVRAEIINSLSSEYPEGNVVFVRYIQPHNVFEEWVYNSAEIDAQKVVWALYKSPEQNDAVMRYYAGRRYWVLLPDVRSLTPYPTQQN